MSTEVQKFKQDSRQVKPASAFSSIAVFEDTMRMAKLLCASTLVPVSYQGAKNISNAVIAIEIAQRVGASPFMVMQNLDIIKGKPSWGSKYVIAALNSCGRFQPLMFEVKDLGNKKVVYTYKIGGEKRNKVVEIDDFSFKAVTKDREGNVLEGPTVTIEMAVKEGWYTKAGSKWVTMPDLMGRYRCAKFFGNLYAPDVLMGMMTVDEVQDIAPNGTEDATYIDLKATSTDKVADLNKLADKAAQSPVDIEEEVTKVPEEPPVEQVEQDETIQPTGGTPPVDVDVEDELI